MRPTLEHLPSEFLGLPIFGIGWVVFGVLGLFGTALLAGNKYRRLAIESVPFAVVLCAIAVFLLPNLEEGYTASDGQQLKGIPIRGYGVMLFLGTIAGVWLAQLRARRRGIDAELIYSCATWLIVAGLVGARAFYVIQYWDEFRSESWGMTFREVFKVTQGGLVVYGALIGAGLAFLAFAQRSRVSLLFLADVFGPPMLLGLAIGRIGCLLNGCCYGGLCDQPWAIRFPPESPAYGHQLSSGSIHGFTWTWQVGDEMPDGNMVVSGVLPGTEAATAGLKPGDVITAINSQPVEIDGAENPTALLSRSALEERLLSLTLANGQQIRLGVGSRPERSQPVHPTQIYSTINAALICLLLLLAEPFMTRTGQLTALMLTVYPITRFLLETIRNDEPAFLQTSLTISQNISVLLIMSAVGLWVYTATRPHGLLTANLRGETAPGN